jgi:flagellar biosynthesis protein FliQ
LAVVAALVIIGPWMGAQIGAFAERMFSLAGR